MFFKIKRTKADALFSDLVRASARFQCERCKRQFKKGDANLHLSHYFSRRNRSVRFDFENVASLCFSCHRYFEENPHDHYEFFLRRLGQKKIDALSVRARTPKKVDETALATAFKMALEKLKNDKIVFRDYKARENTCEDYYDLADDL